MCECECDHIVSIDTPPFLAYRITKTHAVVMCHIHFEVSCTFFGRTDIFPIATYIIAGMCIDLETVLRGAMLAIESPYFK
jgi:hypothetical protein